MNEAVAPRGRPKSERKRQQIFQAAEDLFLANGFDAVSMDMVAEQANVSKQTVYSHFCNKEQLYHQCISRKCISSQIAGEFMDTERPCKDMLLELGRRFCALLLSEPAIWVYRQSMAHAEQRPDLARIFYEAGPANTQKVVAGYLAKQQEKGRLDFPDARQAACQLLYMLKGDAVMKAVLNIGERPSVEEIDDYIQSCVTMFLRAYQPSKATNDKA